MELAEVEKMLAALREEYAAQLPSRLEAMEKNWHALVHADWDPVLLSTIIRQVHSLAGSGATYGLAQVSERARALERFLKELNGASRPTPPEMEKAAQLFAALKETAVEGNRRPA